MAGQRAFGLARSSPSAVIWVKRQSPPSSVASALGCPLLCGDPKASKVFFGYITRLRFQLITRRTQVPPLNDPRRMAFFERDGDRGVRNLLLGCAQPVEPLPSKDLQVAVRRTFGLPLTVLVGYVRAFFAALANSLRKPGIRFAPRADL
jgi:hypothetical protein